MTAKESLESQYKVCQICGIVSGPGIIECPQCQKGDFRLMTEAEKNYPGTIIFFGLEPYTKRIIKVEGCGIFGN